MKILKFIAIAILMTFAGIAAEAQTKYTVIASHNAVSNPFFNARSFGNFFNESTRCGGLTTPLTDAEIDEIVRIHNEVRAQVGAGTLTWNCDLAKFSQNWANADTYEHSTEQQRGQIISGGIAGENLSLDSDTGATMTALNKGWIDEKAFYTYSNNTCAEGKVCGHYTQMVWAKTQQIGCGVFRNSKKMGDAFPNSSYFVCTYYPGGNTAGEKPY